VFRTTHIRTKLAVALAVPLVALVALAGFEVLSARRDVAATRSQTELATASIGPGSLMAHLQNERNRTAIDLIGLDTDLPVANKDEARPPVDKAAAELRAELARHGADVRAAFAPAWKAYADLEALRTEVDAYTGPMDMSNDTMADQVFTRYTNVIEAFFDATSNVALRVDDADLRNGVEIVDAAGRQAEMRARIVRSLVLGVLGGNASSPAVGQEVAALYDRSQGFDNAIRANAEGPYAAVGDATFAEAGVQSFDRQVEGFLAGQPVDITALLDSVKTTPDTGYGALRDRAAGRLVAEAGRIEDAAVARERLFGGLALGSLLAALLVTWLASRSITRPLRSLRDQANRMAGERLPAAVRQILDTPPGEDVVIPVVRPITVSTRDEVAEVAAALSAVQSSAVDLAVEQAVLRRNISDSYINLGRRNQNLLSRQLDFITELERNESDPDTLEGLFRLDHLATRMRRNAESLLVLAGIEPPRQWAAPVKMSDVVRAALGEVEDYQRVIVRHLEPASLTGAVAADVAHVIAELLENALSFSPPDQSVEVKGRLTTGGYTIAIADNGLGMTADELVRANRRLAGLESFTVAPSRYLGHNVAGHLSSRLGVAVELQDSPAGGITARVDVPMGLLANDETDPRLNALARSTTSEAPAVAQPAPAVDEARSVEVVSDAAPSSLTAGGLPRRGERPVTAEPVEPSEPSEPAPVTWPASPTRGAVLPPRPDPAPAPAAVPFVPAPPTVTPEPSFLADVEGDADADADEADEPRVAPRHAAKSAPEPSAADVEEPARAEAPARGFGGLAMTRPPGPSMHTIAARSARAAREAGGAADGPEGGLTATGLTRRVPGAQRPDVPFGARPPAETVAPELTRSTPEDVYSFLSSFQSGVARGRADAHTDDSPEDPR
jgi:signal transduction histidine kinase